jgi:ABC-type multidrug transport system ATPase subunit
MQREFTAHIEQDVESGYFIGVIPSVPGAHTQAKSLDELSIRLKEVLQLCLINQGLMQKRMRTLSGGTRQKVSAALAFLFNPDVLILDEPTAGLDPVASEILKEKIIAEKTKGKLVLITSHILSELDDLITQVIYMQDGKICFHKSIEGLRRDTGQQKLSKAIASVAINMGK